MIDDFVRFPHTPHIAWLGKGEPRGDKILSPPIVDTLLANYIVVEEKIDGANIGISLDNDANVRVQNRGSWIENGTKGQFKHLWTWINLFEDKLKVSLGNDLILFGEWCYAKHSIGYEKLPSWFIGFDVYHKGECKFFSVARRDEFLEEINIPVIKAINQGYFDLCGLKKMLNKPSFYGAKNIEGVYIRSDEEPWLRRRAKLVNANFVQEISEHWSKKRIIVNGVDY